MMQVVPENRCDLFPQDFQRAMLFSNGWAEARSSTEVNGESHPPAIPATAVEGFAETLQKERHSELLGFLERW